MSEQEWLVINYTLPREPSRMRVATWRKLKKLGAVNVQQSMWLLPCTPDNNSMLNQVKDSIAQSGGEAFVLKSTADAPSQQVIIERFNAARNEEYSELLEKCDDFFQEIDKEIGRRNFSFAEIEENEEELEKLKVWYGKIAARDFFAASRRETASETLTRSAEALELFCDKVYENEKIMKKSDII